MRDATDIADKLANKGVALSLGPAVHEPTDPVDRLLFKVLGMVAEFEADLIRGRTREGMAIVKAARELRGRKPKLTAAQEKDLVQVHRTGAHDQRDRGGRQRRLLDGLPRDPEGREEQDE